MTFFNILYAQNTRISINFVFVFTMIPPMRKSNTIHFRHPLIGQTIIYLRDKNPGIRINIILYFNCEPMIYEQAIRGKNTLSASENL